MPSDRVMACSNVDHDASFGAQGMPYFLRSRHIYTSDQMSACCLLAFLLRSGGLGCLIAILARKGLELLPL